MDFDLTKEQEMIRREVRKFAQSEIAPIAPELDERESFSSDLTRKMGEIGLFGMFVSDAYDGQEMDYISYIIAVEEIARIDGSHAATVAAENSLGIGPLYYFGNEEQKKKYLPPLFTGNGILGFAITEPDAGSDTAAATTSAVKDGEDYIINGRKVMIGAELDFCSQTPVNRHCRLNLSTVYQT